MPWKGEKDPYKIWLSEIILQQTRVEQGLSYYHSFINIFLPYMISQMHPKKKYSSFGKDLDTIADAKILSPLQKLFRSK